MKKYPIYYSTLKLIQTINKNSDSGFSIWLLLFLLIGGLGLILISLPNLTGCGGGKQSRESEATNTLGAINRAQQAYYTEYNKFASTFDELEVPMGTMKYYSFSILTDKGITVARGLNNEQNGTKDYIGGVNYDVDTRKFDSVLCRSIEKPNFTISEPTKAIINSGKVHNSTIQCGKGVEERK